MNSMMLMPCWPSAGPTGGAAVAAPAGACTFSIALIFFAMSLLSRCGRGRCAPPSHVVRRPPGRHRSSLELLDLQEVELDRRLAAEDADQHLDLVAFRVDLVDGADELGERAVLDAHALALAVLDLELRRLDPHLLEDLLDLVLVERQRPVARSDERGHARRVA